MEILIILLGLGVVGIVVFFFKTTADDVAREKNIENAKDKRLGELDVEVLRKDTEMKKMMEERQRLEDEFFKTRDEADVLKRENEELASRLKQQEKMKEEFSGLKSELKQKDTVAHQETVARQKLQGELSLKEMECEKLQKELEALKADLKSKSEMYEGLKAQFSELEEEAQRTKGEAFVTKAPAPSQTKPVGAPGPTAPSNPSSPEDLPGFSGAAGAKEKLTGEVPSDTDFLKAKPASEPKTGEETQNPPEAPFRFTNVNPVRNMTTAPDEKKVSKGTDKPAPPPDTPSGA